MYDLSLFVNSAFGAGARSLCCGALSRGALWPSSAPWLLRCRGPGDSSLGPPALGSVAAVQTALAGSVANVGQKVRPDRGSARLSAERGRSSVLGRFTLLPHGTDSKAFQL